MNLEQSPDSLIELSKWIEYFIENTMMQEKLELRPDEDSEDNNKAEKKSEE